MKSSRNRMLLLTRLIASTACAAEKAHLDRWGIVEARISSMRRSEGKVLKIVATNGVEPGSN